MNSLDAASDLSGTNRLLYGNSNGYGFGNGNLQAGHSVLAAGALADGTAAKATADCHAEQFSAGLERVSKQNEETRNLFKLDQILKGQTDSEVRLSKMQVDAEFRSLDRQRDTEKLIVDGQKEAAKCCCDAQLLAVSNKAEMLTAIAATQATALAIEGRAVERNLNAANAELTALKTQIACGCCNSPS